VGRLSCIATVETGSVAAVAVAEVVWRVRRGQVEEPCGVEAIET